ncbi:MAG: hypothetical protein QOC92_2976, partial [Acidimicrobiaceae bacterium]
MDLITDQLRMMASHHPDAVGFRRTDGEEITFAEWDAASNRLARALIASGVTKGDRVAIFLESEEVRCWIVAYAAAHKAGAVAVPTNTRLVRPELERILTHSEAKAMISGGALQASAETLLDAMPSLDVLVSISAKPGGRSLTWTEAMSHDADDIQIPVGPDDLADIMYTSGTTG